ncbi:hypothetical protein PENTCL1PPCAC_3487 [Pristionchus entomophagus]|uniref:Uncharacterized protein n=1 Tax=Pristionchus entomophagus TaxID=358040 RepID=A0AAV5SD60_9BILA|nr:hypothetical protein PENTCL1PPCAC_3487 [Pristionchus entomophagus]
MRSIEKDQSLNSVGSIALLQHARHLEHDAGTIRVADESVGADRLDLPHLLDVSTGNRLDRVLRDILRQLEAVRGEVAATHHIAEWRGNSLNRMSEESDRSILHVVALHHHIARIEIVDVDSHLEDVSQLLLQMLSRVLRRLELALLNHVQFCALKGSACSAALSERLQLLQRKRANILHGDNDVVVALERLLDLHSHERIEAEIAQVRVEIQRRDVVHAEDVRDDLHEVAATRSSSLLVSDVCPDVGRDDGMVPREEQVQGREAGRHALRKGAADHRVVVAHVLQNDTDVTDGSPLDGDARKAVTTTRLDHPLHRGVGPSVVCLTGVSAARYDGREDDEP